VAEAPARNIAAVVLNYRTAAHTIATVQSLQESERRIDCVFVIDNDSGDESCARFKDELDGVTVVSATRNHGFSAGCNLGIREAMTQGAHRVLVLNPDVVVKPDAMARLDEAMTSGVGIVGPVLLNASHGNVIESAGMTYSTATGRMRHTHAGESPAAVRMLDVTEVPAVSGCAMLIRREVFETIGLFAEDYFYGFEDLEFCLRAKAAGFRTVCATQAVVYHEGAASISRDSPRRLYFAARNHLLLASRVGPQPWPVRVARAANIVGLNVAHAVFRSATPVSAGLAAVIRGVRDHMKGKYGADEPPPT
jgi:GT2 family glycosyltransferase